MEPDVQRILDQDQADQEDDGLSECQAGREGEVQGETQEEDKKLFRPVKRLHQEEKFQEEQNSYSDRNLRKLGKAKQRTVAAVK